MGAGFGFHTEPFEIQPGFTVTVDDGVNVRVLEVVDVTIDVVDEDADVVSGMAPGDTWVYVNAGNEWDWCDLEVLSEPDGSWLADFSGGSCVMDLAPGTGGAAQVFDEDGDSTHRGWQVPNPAFGVQPQSDEMWGGDWEPDSSATVEVFESDHITAKGSPVVVPTDEWGNFGVELGSEDPPIDVVPGDYVVVTQGATVKTHVVTELKVDFIDHISDTATGTANPLAQINSWIRGEGMWVQSFADEFGHWLIDYSGVWDVQPGTEVGFLESDADGDQTAVTAVAPQFPDVSLDHWAADHIEAIFDAGITSGYIDGTYRPEGLVNRSEMAVFLVRALDGPDADPPIPAEDPFPDVPVSHWASGWIARLVELGITSGYEDGTYEPEGRVNRSEMAVFLVRGVDGPAAVPPIPAEDPFPDVPVSHWASGWIDRLVELGITAGYADGTYRPDRLVNRAEMATFLDRAFLGG